VVSYKGYRGDSARDLRAMEIAQGRNYVEGLVVLGKEQPSLVEHYGADAARQIINNWTATNSPAEATTTISKISSILYPTDEEELTPEEPPHDPPPVVPQDPPGGWDAPDWVRSLQEFAQGPMNRLVNASQAVLGRPAVIELEGGWFKSVLESNALGNLSPIGAKVPTLLGGAEVNELSSILGFRRIPR